MWMLRRYRYAGHSGRDGPGDGVCLFLGAGGGSKYPGGRIGGRSG